MIYFLGDVHGSFRHVLDVVNRDRPDAIVFLGDLELQKPFEEELKSILNKTEIWFIHGNHDTDSQVIYDRLFNSAFKDRNLHGRVVDVCGVLIAGLGGVFRESIWHPSRHNPEVHYESYEEYARTLNAGKILRSHDSINNEDNANIQKTKGLLLKHRSSIFYQDYFELCGLRADILVTHEAPSCHPNGVAEIDELAKALGVNCSFHGHHHDCLDYQSFEARLGFKAFGVGRCGITNQYGEIILPGELDDARKDRGTHAPAHS